MLHENSTLPRTLNPIKLWKQDLRNVFSYSFKFLFERSRRNTTNSLLLTFLLSSITSNPSAHPNVCLLEIYSETDPFSELPLLPCCPQTPVMPTEVTTAACPPAQPFRPSAPLSAAARLILSNRVSSCPFLCWKHAHGFPTSVILIHNKCQVFKMAPKPCLIGLPIRDPHYIRLLLLPQKHPPLWCLQAMPGMFLPQGRCTWCSLGLGRSVPRHLHGLLPYLPRVFAQMSPFGEAFHSHPV